MNLVYLIVLHVEADSLPHFVLVQNSNSAPKAIWYGSTPTSAKSENCNPKQCFFLFVPVKCLKISHIPYWGRGPL